MPASWKDEIWAAFHTNRLTRATRDVLLCLHGYRSAGGVAWPSHQTLAERARCSVRTVQRALAAAAGLDLIRWTMRRIARGWRVVRSSNVYRFGTGAPRPPALVRSTGHNDAVDRDSEKREAACDHDARGGRATRSAGDAAGGHRGPPG